MTRSGKAIIASAALVLLVGACGSSSSKSLSPGGSSGNSSGSSSNSNSSGGNSLADLLGKSKTADAKVTYTSDGGNPFTYIQRGNDSVLKSGDTSFYTVGGKTTTCTGSGSSAECTTISSGGTGLSAGLGAGLFGTYSKLLDSLATSPLVKDVKTSSDTIAGRSAKCVTLTGALAAAGQSGTVCVDSQTGVLLRVEAEGKKQFEATDVGSPSDSDFTLPATPKTLSIPSYTVPTTP